MFCLVAPVAITSSWAHEIGELPARVRPTDEKAEKEALEQLFRINSEIELASNKSDLLRKQIEELEQEILEKERVMIALIGERDAYLSDLRDLLVAQQKLGAGNGLQMLLKSSSLADYFRRISFVSELGRAYRGAVQSLEEKEDEVQIARAELVITRERVRTEREEVLSLIRKLESSKIELERYLASFAESRQAYEKHLKEIQERWDSLKPLFNRTVKAFVQIIEEGGLPPETVELRFSLFGSPTAIIEEAKFNRIIQERKELPELIFHFLDGEMELEFPSYEVRLLGRFEVVEKKMLEFQVASGEFYGMPMSEDALEDLFLKQPFRFDLSGLIQKNELNEIQHKKGRIEIRVTIRF